MTQKQKVLLLKDLCARLPYGVIVNVKGFDYDYNSKLTQIYNGVGCSIQVTTNMPYDIEQVKPYLFPLSSMTEEQEKDIFHNGKFYIDHHNSICRFPTNEDDYDFVTVEDCLEIFNKLIKNHFDIYGLIPMGLAIDATGLNIY